MTLATVLTLVGIVGTGVMTGVYVAFSVMVMPALDRRPPGEAVGFMQATNRYALRPPFQLAFSGTAAVAVALTVIAFVVDDTDRGRLLVGSVTYLLTVVVTGVFHVPRNNGIDAVDAADAEASLVAWRAYSRPWRLGNDVRALLCVLALVAYADALRVA
ncbi:DUF1772 domain-containing protein [Mumia sp. zg.B53]|uniref:anthrone oxygenase family protein n=1 Tax=Mumia sp. zg.B53 TaxID=2855449 RepID=UPI001C6F2C6F|nr:anthrone oxygenase family protein [Mumia sp. zg.B53]MBW9213508.1 DUF1772 domain-containing protein [Mumia sp. zg.B53]